MYIFFITIGIPPALTIVQFDFTGEPPFRFPCEYCELI
jgi:hypothetical protein